MTVSGIQRFLQKKSTTTFDKTSAGEIICEVQQNGKIDGKIKINDDKNSIILFTMIMLFMTIKFLRKFPSKFIRKLATINLIFQKNQSILHQLTLIMMIIAKPIKIFLVNILILMIQIKLHLKAKLL